MEKLKAALKGLFFLPPVPTVLCAAFGYGFVLAAALLSVQSPVVLYASYLSSAYALIVTATGFRHIPAAIGSVRRLISSHPLMKKFRATAAGEKYMTDARFRAEVSLYQGFIINLLYIVMKLASGIAYRSVWFISLAAYYALLALMRIVLIHRVGARDAKTEWRRYRLCGIILLVMNQALAGMVALMVHQNRDFDYPGLLIYGMALYAFYAVISAAVSVVKARRQGSPILSAAKAIHLVAAMVSILSLETAMLARFGDDDPIFRRVMTGATGGGVCTAVIGLAIYMILRANAHLKKMEASCA